MNRTLAELWEYFRAVVIDKNTQTVQLQEMRRAFYAGVWAVITEPNTDSDSLDVFATECTAFKEAVLRGEA